MANDNEEYPRSRDEAEGAAGNAAAANKGIRYRTLPSNSTSAAAGLSLQRNSSITSTYSHSSRSSIVGIGSRVTSTAMFPASPALSTLSKNTSSSGSSSLASAKLSVDDILSSNKISRGARQKRMRMQGTATPKPAAVSRARPPPAPSSSHTPQMNNTTAHSKLSSAKRPRLPSPGKNPGQEDRRKRLERLQKEQLKQQQKWLGQQQQGGASKRSHSLERLIKMEETSEKEKEERPGEIHSSQELPISQPYDAHSHNSKNAENSGKKEVKSTETTPRRSRRAKAVASYNITELVNNNIISEETGAMRKSPPETLNSSPVSLKSSQMADVMSGKREQNALGDEVMTPKKQMIQPKEEPEVEESPESAASALAILLAKYNTCLNQNDNTAKEEGGETSSAWKVVQLFLSVLRFINLYDPNSMKSEECQHVERGLAKVLKSVDRIKWEVMNRNTNSNEASTEEGGQDEGNNAQKEAKLLQSIQVQLWIRMMVWSLEQEVGLEFLGRVIELADVTNEVNVVNAEDGDGKKGKKKKGKKKRKKSKKEKVQQQQSTNAPFMSPRDGLVGDIRVLAELAPYVLPTSMDFSHWLKDTLTFGYRQSLPEYAAELFDHFEIDIAAEPIVLKRNGTDASHASSRSRRSDRSEVSHSPLSKQDNSKNLGEGSSPMKDMMEKRNTRQRAYFASLAEEEKASNQAADDETATITGSLSTVTSTSKASRNSLREKDDTILFKTSVSLTSHTARTKNPFLKGSARQEYVGSHLSSKLSNITSLFREVKAAPKPKPSKPKPAVPTAVKRNVLPSKRPDIVRGGKLLAESTISVQSAGEARKPKGKSAGIAKTRRLLSSSPVKETPRKRLRPTNAAATASFRGAAPLFSSQVEETPSRPIVEETPAGNRRSLPLRHLYQLDSIMEETPLVGNSIIAETPQQQQQPKRGSKTSTVLPTTLWRAHDTTHQPRSQQSTQISRRPRRQQGGNSNNKPGQLTPMSRAYGRGAAAASSSSSRSGRAAPMNNFDLSPTPQREDMASVMTQAAKAHAARKKK